MIRKGTASVIVILGVVASVWAAQRQGVVRIGGKFVTDDVIVSDGKVYVPVSVLADALRLQVRATSEGCDLVRSTSGADDLNRPLEKDGYRLEVLDVARVKKYRVANGYYDFPVVAAPGNELVVVRCRLGNLTGSSQSINLTAGRDTSLSDARYRSYAPLRGTGGRVLGGMLSMLADGQADFALKFEVPAGFRPDRLVVSIQSKFNQAPTDFRISLGRP